MSGIIYYIGDGEFYMKNGIQDNLMKNMALNVNAMEYERKRETQMTVSANKQKAGKAAFWILLGSVVVVAAIYIAMH